MAQHIAIIGGGQAAVSCAAKLRTLDGDCAITLFADESVLPYQRPPLSKKYATGEMTAEQLLLRPADWFAANNITCMTGVRVVDVNPEDQSLALENGEKHPWDKLVFATGSRARSLPASIGGSLNGVFELRSLSDADAFGNQLKEGRKLVIVGGGYIGLEAAAVCAGLGLEVTLIEAAERILQRVACAETSDWFRELHKGHGVNIIENAKLTHFAETDGSVSAVVLDDGSEIECDFALIGIGILPNDELAEACGLETGSGIVVNALGQSSNTNIYAAGDCAIFNYQGEKTRLESVQNAIDQAECVAINIAGRQQEYRPYPWFWSDQYDIKLQIAGLNRGYDKIVVRQGDREGTVSHFYFKGQQLLAVDSMNDPRTYMVCKKMLEAGRNIDPTQAADQELQLKSLL